MSVKRVLAIAALPVLAHLALVVLLPTPKDSRVTIGGVEWFAFRRVSPIEDDHDRGVYLQRGSWLPRRQVPYLEVHSEYPEIATWLCAIPYLFIDAPSDPAAYAGLPPDDLVERYLNLHSAEMAVALLLLIWVTALLARHLGNDPRRAWFLLLPGTMYFALSRYDVVPALLISASLLLLVRRRHLMATFVLSLAVLTKWYPIVFLPFYLSYIKHSLNRRVIPPLALSAATALVVIGTTFVTSGRRFVEILEESPRPKQEIAQLETEPSPRGRALPKLPGAARAAVDALPESWRAFAEGGLRAVLSPYLFQGERKTNAGGIYYQMQARWFPDRIEPDSDLEKWILRALTVLQFAILFFGLFVRVRSDEQLIRWLCLGTACFVLFAKFYSPQWVIWTTALAAPFMRSRALIATTVLLEVLIYAQLGILRSTPLHGKLNPDGTFARTDFWYHLYDARMILTALFTVLVAWSIFRLGRGSGGLDARGAGAMGGARAG